MPQIGFRVLVYLYPFGMLINVDGVTEMFINDSCFDNGGISGVYWIES